MFSSIGMVKSQNLDSSWNSLLSRKTICIGGQQYRFDHPEMRVPLFFSTHEWKAFTELDNSETGPFLLSFLDDTSTTKIHTCPFELATKGEMAVYALQQLTETNWYEFESFREYAAMPVSDNQNLQRSLWAILQNEKKRETLKGEYQKLIEIK
jgi:hypothetical protein